MESVRFILTGLVAGLLLSSVESFAPVKSVTREQLPITAVQAFSLPDFSSFFGGAAAPKTASKGDSKSTKTNVIAGASGYIGKSTVRESVRQGYNTIALVRDLEKIENAQGQAIYGQFYEGAKVVQCDVCDTEALTKVSDIPKLHEQYMNMNMNMANVVYVRYYTMEKKPFCHPFCSNRHPYELVRLWLRLLLKTMVSKQSYHVSLPDLESRRMHTKSITRLHSTALMQDVMNLSRQDILYFFPHIAVRIPGCNFSRLNLSLRLPCRIKMI